MQGLGYDLAGTVSFSLLVWHLRTVNTIQELGESFNGVIFIFPFVALILFAIESGVIGG